jgi:hypothetical protein
MIVNATNRQIETIEVTTSQTDATTSTAELTSPTTTTTTTTSTTTTPPVIHIIKNLRLHQIMINLTSLAKIFAQHLTTPQRLILRISN